LSRRGTTFPASIIGNRAGPRSQVDDRHQLPAVDRHDGHDGHDGHHGHHGHRCEPWPWMIGTTWHHGHHRGRCEPWPWMIGTGTTFPPSIIGNRPGPRSQVDDRHQLPGVDRHGHHGHDVPGVDRHHGHDGHHLPAVDRQQGRTAQPGR
jgi:hypothetical protein